MQRLWLQNVGVFEIIPNSGQGSCLFQAISQALTCSAKYHLKIRRSIVNHMTFPTRLQKLDELPEFWKRKIISDWLASERVNIFETRTREKNKEGLNRAFLFTRKRFCFRLMDLFVKRKRLFRYNKIKKLMQKNKLTGPKYIKSFKYIYQEFMSYPHEPGTRYELEAASNNFQFHYDFFQALPLNYPHLLSSSNENNKVNNNNEPSYDLESKNEVTPKTNENIKDEINKRAKMGKYKFYSCENKSCNFSNMPDVDVFIDHFYFLHSPTIPSCDSAKFECQSGHWELLLPIHLCINPIPENTGCIVGFTYDITDSERNFVIAEDGGKREILDDVAIAIDSYVQKHPSVIPENTLPACDEDDCGGGCSSTTNMFCNDRIQLGFSNQNTNGNGNCNEESLINWENLNNCSNTDNHHYTKVNPNLSTEMSEIEDKEKHSIRDLMKRWNTLLARRAYQLQRKQRPHLL